MEKNRWKGARGVGRGELQGVLTVGIPMAFIIASSSALTPALRSTSHSLHGRLLLLLLGASGPPSPAAAFVVAVAVAAAPWAASAVPGRRRRAAVTVVPPAASAVPGRRREGCGHRSRLPGPAMAPPGSGASRCPSSGPAHNHISNTMRNARL